MKLRYRINNNTALRGGQWIPRCTSAQSAFLHHLLLHFSSQPPSALGVFVPIYSRTIDPFVFVVHLKKTACRSKILITGREGARGGHHRISQDHNFHGPLSSNKDCCCCTEDEISRLTAPTDSIAACLPLMNVMTNAFG